MIVVDTNVIGYLFLSSKQSFLAIFISNHLKIFGTQESCSKFSWQLHEDRRLAQVLIQMMLVIV
jgi:hypothetical protein